MKFRAVIDPVRLRTPGESRGPYRGPYGDGLYRPSPIFTFELFYVERRRRIMLGIITGFFRPSNPMLWISTVSGAIGGVVAYFVAEVFDDDDSILAIGLFGESLDGVSQYEQYNAYVSKRSFLKSKLPVVDLWEAESKPGGAHIFGYWEQAEKAYQHHLNPDLPIVPPDKTVRIPILKDGNYPGDPEPGDFDAWLMLAINEPDENFSITAFRRFMRNKKDSK